MCEWGGEACTCVKVWCRSGCMRVYRAVCQSRRVLKKHMRFPKAMGWGGGVRVSMGGLGCGGEGEYGWGGVGWGVGVGVRVSMGGVGCGCGGEGEYGWGVVGCGGSG